MKTNRLAALFSAVAIGFSIVAMPIQAAAEKGYPFRTTCNYYYDQFSPNARKLYDDIYAVALMVDDSDDTYLEMPEIPYSGLSQKEFTDTVKMFSFDHPEFFWLANTFSYGYTYTGQHFLQIDIFSQYQDGSARKSAKEKLLSIEQDYINGAMQYDTDYDRAKYLSERLYTDVTYEEVGGYLDQSLASTFLYKKTVCTGFTKAYCLLANAVGVDTVALRSDVHAWNATKVADQWYVDDVTNRLFLYNDSQVEAYDKRVGVQEITYPDGQVKQSMMHELGYDYYTDIFPDTSVSYNGDKKVIEVQQETEPPTEPPTAPPTEPPTNPPVQNPTEPDLTGDTPIDDGTYQSEAQTAYFFSDDTEEIDPEMLVMSMQESMDLSEFGLPAGLGNWSIQVDVTDLSDLTLSKGWRTPGEILENHAAGAPYYHGPLQAEMDGHKLAVGDVWIFRRGDFNMDGKVNAVDATDILICAASVGTGRTPVLPAGKDEDAAIFAGKYLEDDNDYPNASDATAVLIYAAKAGTGQI
ncbi:MAG: hypothetical protein K6F80_01870 [Oscillospiraceae bacterium]|nr:hypothetical protein [Oscillospiraceae bacterium]